MITKAWAVWSYKSAIAAPNIWLIFYSHLPVDQVINLVGHLCCYPSQPILHVIVIGLAVSVSASSTGSRQGNLFWGSQLGGKLSVASFDPMFTAVSAC